MSSVSSVVIFVCLHPADREETAAVVAASSILRLTPPAVTSSAALHAERQSDVATRNMPGTQTVSHRHAQIADHAQHDFFQRVALIFMSVLHNPAFRQR